MEEPVEASYRHWSGPCLVIRRLTVNYDPRRSTLNQSRRNQLDDDDDDDAARSLELRFTSTDERQFIRPSRTHASPRLPPPPPPCAAATTLRWVPRPHTWVGRSVGRSVGPEARSRLIRCGKSAVSRQPTAAGRRQIVRRRCLLTTGTAPDCRAAARLASSLSHSALCVSAERQPLNLTTHTHARTLARSAMAAICRSTGVGLHGDCR